MRQVLHVPMLIRVRLRYLHAYLVDLGVVPSHRHAHTSNHLGCPHGFHVEISLLDSRRPLRQVWLVLRLVSGLLKLSWKLAAK